MYTRDRSVGDGVDSIYQPTHTVFHTPASASYIDGGEICTGVLSSLSTER